MAEVPNSMSSVDLQEFIAEPVAVPSPPSRGRFRYGLTIFCGAFLLFQVQLLLGKYILPWFGGTPAVWTTCMLFFQLLLLGGYLYAHLLSTKLNARSQTVVHLTVLGASVALVALGALFWKTPLLPGPSWRPNSSDFPVTHILRLLLVAVGLPYLCLSASGPLLQTWFGRAHPGKSPYRLYALSNIGSLLGLVTYPFAVEPAFRLHTQAWLWSAAYMVFFAGFVACAKDMKATVMLGLAVEESEATAPPSGAVQCLWFLLPAMASLMLLATTNLMCQEVAVIPFLWVLPLSLYLISFIICFDNLKWYQRGIFQALLGASLPLALIVLLSSDTAPIVRQVWMLSLVLFACCMVCHGELVHLKPHPSYLTRFYLLISAGGAAGGIFVALIAPRIFTGFWEFHFGLVGCVLLAMLALARDRQSWWYWNKPYIGSAILLGLVLSLEFVARYARLAMIPITMYRWHYYPVLTVLAVWVAFITLRSGKRLAKYRRFNSAQLAAIVVVLALCAALYGQVQFDKYLAIRRDRNFYAAVMIREEGSGHTAIELRHGQTTHGYQLYRQPGEPTTYYSHRSGVGLLLDTEAACLRPCPRRYGFIGLGVGTLAAYAHAGDTVWFYELNPQVIAYSFADKPYFTFIKNSPAKIEVVPGDARLSLEREFRETGSQNFDVLVVDAFSSDAIPIHLLTQEALEIYLEHLRGPDSVVAFHISNKMLDLNPVLATLAAHNHLAAVRLHKKHPDLGEGSDWILLAKNPSALALNAFHDHLDSMPPPNPKLLWTDDYSDLFAVLRLR
jgi:spermidine synthase